ncbi:uncharacterized protein SOCE26_091130 [Sorangium cellulosum]|uniref:Uncharacterized protein n=1 Tax=Sorangium cellulosum TaxID=56 RepID=A0A2L0F7X7_SORCE|nr:uncharacterized protein SOCE26_091130 [Sorangium cellulosum]
MSPSPTPRVSMSSVCRRFKVRHGPLAVQPSRWAGPLVPELEAFLAAGEPSAYVGFGSMLVDPQTGRAVIEAVRAARRRVALSQGWAELGRVDDAADPDAEPQQPRTARTRGRGDVADVGCTDGSCGIYDARGTAGAPGQGIGPRCARPPPPLRLRRR